MPRAATKNAEPKGTILYTGVRLEYAEAVNYTKGAGGLPRHVLLDKVTVSTAPEAECLESERYWPGGARELLAYPEMGGVFKKGYDVVDSFRDDKGRAWILPASSIPEEALDKPYMGLLVDPSGLEITSRSVVVLAEPHLITPLCPFLQTKGDFGKVDRATGIPLIVPYKLEKEALHGESKRWLWRIDGVGIRPLIRSHDPVFGLRRQVSAYAKHCTPFGVATVAPTQPTPIELRRTI